jgi:hypothetical protein
MNGPACARLYCVTPHLGDAHDISVFEFNPPRAPGAPSFLQAPSTSAQSAFQAHRHAIPAHNRAASLMAQRNDRVGGDIKR